MKTSFLFLFCFWMQFCLGQNTDTRPGKDTAMIQQGRDTVTIQLGVFKVRRLAEPLPDTFVDEKSDFIHPDRNFMPFQYPHGISFGYQQGKYSFAELGVWGFRNNAFISIRGLYLESDFKNTHALMFSGSHGFIKYGKTTVSGRATLLRYGVDAGPVYDLGRFDLLMRPFLGLNIPGRRWPSHIQINAGYNFRLNEKDPYETNKFFVSGRFYIP